MWILIYTFIFMLAFSLSLGLTAVMKRLAGRLNIIDRPDKRKLHQNPTPLLGGIAIFLAFNLTIILNLIILCFLQKNSWLPPQLAQTLSGLSRVRLELFAILFAGLFIMLLGLIDDIKKLSPRIKLLVEIILAILLYYSGVKITVFLKSEICSLFITVFWIVGVTNAFNLMDNMDGLCGGVAAVAAAIFFTVSVSHQQYFVSCIAIAFIAVLIGFLRFNFPPAKIFMGDAGSLYIGYVLSILTIISTFYTTRSPTALPIIMPFLILAVPIFDTLSVIYIRSQNRRPIFIGDTNHFSHRLLRLGLTTRQTVLFIYLVTFCLGLGALLLRNLAFGPALIILIQAMCIIAIIVILENVKTK